MAHSNLGSVQPLVYVDHKGMEMDATFASDCGGKSLVEDVHEHRLARPYVTVQVETFGGRGGRSRRYGRLAR